MGGLAQRLVALVPSYLKIAWWGLVAPRVSERAPLRVYQGVVLSDAEILLAVRADLHGWELPGGNANPGEDAEAAIVREIREETGLEVRVERHVGDYTRTGFRPHTARVFTCRAVGGRLQPGRETLAVRWFDPARLPDTLFPWYRTPVADALRVGAAPVSRCEHQGLSAIWAGMVTDLRMRISNDRAGLPPENSHPRGA